MFELRPSTDGDRAALIEICRITEFPMNAPRDPARDPDLLGLVYAAPYPVADPGLSTVVVSRADDGAERVVGYLVATRDTRAFESWLETEWMPQLRLRYPAGSGAASEAWLIDHVHSPGTAPDDVVSGHPAHFHIDLLAEAQGHGLGRRLIERVLGQLADRDVPGVHLGVVAENVDAIAFYERLGFTRFRAEPTVVWMTRSI
jgi:ribosomal protein S18 acetylase RimI-like enzyme